MWQFPDMIRSVVLGTGSHLPERVVTNSDLERMVDTSDQWIVERTGIERRHVAGEGELTSDLAITAASRALEAAGLGPDDIDLIIVATTTPDDTFPSTAGKVQAGLGVHQGAAFDVQAVCSGFIYALTVADSMIRVGQAKAAVIIGAETMSRLLDWSDRTTCVLFGDGAGAVVLAAREEDAGRGILAARLHADGRQRDLLYTDGGPSSTQTSGHVRMLGREVFRHAVNNLTSVVHEVLEDAKLAPSDLDWIVPHQANKRIIDGTARKLNIDSGKVVLTVQEHGNTSAASVPLALDVAVRDGRIQPGDLVLLEAMGAGFTWGAALVRW
jgi:3-oxoacyl-[acyl-carrier-protein] synthase-3